MAGHVGVVNVWRKGGTVPVNRPQPNRVSLDVASARVVVYDYQDSKRWAQSSWKWQPAFAGILCCQIAPSPPPPSIPPIPRGRPSKRSKGMNAPRNVRHPHVSWYRPFTAQNQKRQELLARRRNERGNSSQFECCGRNGSQRRPAISSVQDVEGGSVTSGGSRPSSLNVASGAKRGIPAGGSWGGVGMGIGVT